MKVVIFVPIFQRSMLLKSIPYENARFFSKLICDYLSNDAGLESFYNRFPVLENFDAQIKEMSFSDSARKNLVKSLNEQYNGFEISNETQVNIDSLLDEKTFTVTTGHQLNLFTGPLYTFYKIISVVNMTKVLKARYHDFNFVPVFWMASEDHDFEEINFFNHKNDIIRWKSEQGGPVGRYSTQGLEDVFKNFSALLGQLDNETELKRIFKAAYVEQKNLGHATRFLVNTLFNDHGIVIVDGDDPHLKKNFIPYAQKEIESNTGYKTITKTTARLTGLGYKQQVQPREINLFYLDTGLRERIIEEEGIFKVNNTDIAFSKSEIIDLLNKEPQRFSPNALLRPLYQEVVLPNICYIGGGGELAYWFQLKDYFDKVGVVYPVLALRNSVMLVTDKELNKLEKLDWAVIDLFSKEEEIKKGYTLKHSDLNIDFSEQREVLVKQFDGLMSLAEETDASFVGAVEAQRTKQLNGLDKLEKRLLKAEKRVLSDRIERLLSIKEKLFPGDNLQERQLNFSEFYVELGPQLIEILAANLDPLDFRFSILKV